MRRLIVPSLLILGFATWLWAQPFVTGGDPWWRPLAPSGQSYGVTAGNVLPTDLLRTGELALDLDAADDGGPLLYLYDAVNATWDQVSFNVGALTADTLIKVNAAGTDFNDSLFSDDGTAITAAGVILATDGAVGAPSYAFTNGDDTGLYIVGTNSMRLAMGGEVRMLWADEAAAGSAITHVQIEYDAAAMDDNTDVARGLFINSGDTGNHTAAVTAPLEVALDIDGITDDAQATEVGIRVGSGWDYSLDFGSGVRLTDQSITNSLAVEIAGTVQTAFNNLSATTDAVRIFETWPANPQGSALLELAGTSIAMNGSDTERGVFIDVANANHTGAVNILVGLDIDPITADAQANEIGVLIGGGWETGVQSAGRVLVRESFEQPFIVLEEDYTAKVLTDASIHTVHGSPSGIVEYFEEQLKTASSWVIADGDLDISADNGAADNEGVEIILGDDDDATSSWVVAQTDTLCFSASITTTLIAGTDQMLVGWRTAGAFDAAINPANYTTFAYVGQTNIDGSIFLFVDDGDSANDDSGTNIADASTNTYKVCMEADGGAAGYLNGTEITNTNTTGQLIAAGTNMVPFISYMSVIGTDAGILIHYWEITGS